MKTTTPAKSKDTEIGPIREEWSVFDLSKCLDLVIDHRGLTPKKLGGDWSDAGVQAISAKNIKDGQLTNFNEFKFVDEALYKKWMPEELKAGDLLLTSEAPLGETYLVKDGERFCLSQRLFALRTKKDILDPGYLFYFLHTSKGQQELHGRATGSVVQGIRQSELLKIEVDAPSLAEQKFIASILSSLDDKIELNRQININLEKITSALFKRWFVDFEFPDKNGRPYKSNGGKIVDSELGEIPEGWIIEPLDKVANFLNGLALQKYPAESQTESLPVIKIRELKTGISESTERASNKVPSDYVIKDGEVLFSWSGSLEVKIWTGGLGALNQHLFKVTSGKYTKWFYYQWVKWFLPNFQVIAASKAVTMGHIKREHLTESLVLIPTTTALSSMDSVLSPILERVIASSLEVRRLSELRDSLLPRLMSGKIRTNV